jgi:hypothetical protein
MDTAVTSTPSKLVAFWPIDGRTYADPHVRSAQLRYADFEESGEPAASERMKPFASSRSAAEDAAPTEQADLTRLRAVRWRDKPPLRLFRGDSRAHRYLARFAEGRRHHRYLSVCDRCAGLDFMGVTDHSFYVRQNYLLYDWWRSRQIATMFNNSGTSLHSPSRTSARSVTPAGIAT